MTNGKINTNHIYMAATNYWSPLDDNDNEDNKENYEEINTTQSPATTIKKKANKWTRQIIRQRQHKIIIDYGATSHFMSEDLNLPREGPSNKEVYLPNNAKLKTSQRTTLPKQ